MRNTLVLRIGGESLRFDASTPLPITTADCYEWARPSGLSWSYGDIALVKVAVPVANATGAPAVSGFAQVGKELTAAKDTIADVDGLPDTFPDDYAFQWVRVDTDGTSNRTVIAGATSSTYTPDADDLGKRIKVEVSFEDDDGTAEGPLASAATPAVAAAPRACTTGAAWCAKLTVGRKGTGDPTRDPKGYCTPAARGNDCTPAFGALDDDDFTLDTVTYTVESIRWGSEIGKSTHLTLDKDFPSAGLRGLTLKVGGLSLALSDAARGNADGLTDVANNYRWQGTVSAAIRDLPVGLDVTVELLVSDNNFATGAPAISGTARAGETLTAAKDNIADVDGLPDTFPTDYTLQWVRVDADGTNPVNIGTNSGTYALVADDVGKKIKVEVSFQDDDGNDEEVTSEPYPSGTATVGVANNPATGAPAISGTARAGETLTAAIGNIADVDMLPDTFPDDYTFQWVRVNADDTNPVNIGTDLYTYALVADDVGKKIKVEVSFQDKGGADEEVTSAAYPSGTETVRAANTPATGAPTISGTATVGQTLTAARGSIADTDGVPDIFPDDYTFQWIRVDADGESNREEISGATARTYTLVAVDAGKRFRVRVGFTDGEGHAEARTSAATVPPPDCTAGHIWCATLTVARNPTGNDKPHGYCDPAAGSSRCTPGYGGLSDTDFDLDGTTYTVESLRWGTDLVDGSGTLHLTLDRDFPAASLGRVTLRVGSHFFAPGSASRSNENDDVANNYRWTPAPAAIRGRKRSVGPWSQTVERVIHIEWRLLIEGW